MILLFSALLVTGCRPSGAADPWQHRDFEPLPPEQNLLNPGRGFYTADIDLLHPDEDGYSAVRKRGYTLAYAYSTWLPADRDLTKDELATLQRGFDLVRKSGFKLILRFRYSSKGDAEWDRIKHHLKQLAPLIKRNTDVIAVLQAGFLGRWGEWHCWQATGPCHDGADEKKYVLDRLLAALAEAGTEGPPLAIRYPPDKARYLGDIDFSNHNRVPPPPQPLTGFGNGAGPRTRIAHHNDCFLSGADDVGTYPDNPPERIAQWRKFTYAENEFLVFGGETCRDEDPDDPARSRGKRALREMEQAHVDYLNAGYHRGMLEHWRNDGIYEEVAARLGYRLVLERAEWMRPQAGEAWQLRLTLRNDGFSRLKRRYNLVAVLQGAGGTAERPLGFDLRELAAGARMTFASGNLAGLPTGRWRLGVAVRDPAPALARRAEYGIRFANDLDYDGVNWLGILEVR